MSGIAKAFEQLRAMPGLVKWLPLILFVVPLVFLSVKLLRDLKSWRRSRPVRKRLTLRRTWNAFVRRTPAKQRRTLGLLQPFVVLGELGAGKTTLIDTHLDWRGHAAQFQPSHVEDPLLQIYRGTNAIVQELSAALLEDASTAARRALARLWRPLARGRTPEVLVVLDAGRLLHAPAEQLVRRAQLLRGKLNLLGEIVRHPIAVTVVVSKADQLPGFRDVASLLRERRAPFRVQPAPDGTLALAPAFAAFEKMVPAVLADRNAEAYLSALALLDKLPSLVAPLETFLGALGNADTITPAPRVRAVALHASEEDGGLEPFAAEITAADVRRFRPLRKHTLAAAGVAAAALLAMIGSYGAARARVAASSQRLDALLDAPAAPEAETAWQATTAEARQSLARRLLPRFFASDPRFGDAELRRRFVAGVRTRLLRPRLDDDQEQRLYALTLLYASAANPLGTFILEHPKQWSSALGLSPSLVIEYIDAADALAAPAAEVGQLPQPAAWSPRVDPGGLTDWLTQLQRRLAQPFLTLDELHALQQTGARARRDAERVAARANLAAAVALMQDGGDAALRASSRRVAAQADPLPAAVSRLVDLVAANTIQTPDVTRLDLAGLAAALDHLPSTPAQTAAPITLTVDGQALTVDPAAWQQLLGRSRVTLLVRAFVERQDDGIEALFAAPSYPPVTLTARGDGCTFAGGARIEGAYTVRAFTDHVVPALTALPPLVAKLPLTEDDKQQLDNRIDEALSNYAELYVEQYRGLIESLRCRARSPMELRMLLSQLPAPSSPLRAALREVTRNTVLPLPKDSPYAAPFDGISDAFAALRALAPPAGPAAQLEGWLAVLRGMQAALDGRAPVPTDKEPEGSLRQRLSPPGRLALAIYRGDEDSPKAQLDRWLAAANIDTEWWPAFAAPVEQAYALGRHDLQKTLAEAWNELVQAYVQPLAEAFPFKRDAETPATAALLEPALMPKRELWSAFEAAVGPALTAARDGWRPIEGRGSPLFPSDLLPTVNRMNALASSLWDKEGKPKPLVVRVRPVPLPPAHNDGPPLLGSFLQVGATTLYGFNQRADWIAVKVEWWKAESASVGVVVGGKDGTRSYRALSVGETPWSFWRLVQRAADEGAKVFTWQVPGPDGHAIAVQFELKDDPWTRFALR